MYSWHHTSMTKGNNHLPNGNVSPVFETLRIRYQYENNWVCKQGYQSDKKYQTASEAGIGTYLHTAKTMGQLDCLRANLIYNEKYKKKVLKKKLYLMVPMLLIEKKVHR